MSVRDYAKPPPTEIRAAEFIPAVLVVEPKDRRDKPAGSSQNRVR